MPTHYPGDEDDSDPDDPDLEDQDQDDAGSDVPGESVPCPFCRKPVHESADVCPHCRNFISMDESLARNHRWIILTALALLAAAAAGYFLLHHPLF